MTIFPNNFQGKIKIDIRLKFNNIYYFRYTKEPEEMRLDIIREEVFKNLPKYNANPDDLYIHIRGGDIFMNDINPNYSQPPLCFYQKIINENEYNNYYILSIDHRNPVVDELLKLNISIRYIHGSLIEDISVIVNSYNIVLSVSTFSASLIRLNNNLKNVYIYEIINYKLKNINYTIHIMKPSSRYILIMKQKWKKTKEQLDLMLEEKCLNESLNSII